VPVGVTRHRTQRPRGQVGPPGPHPAHPSSPLDPGERTVAKSAAPGPSDRAAGRCSGSLLSTELVYRGPGDCNCTLASIVVDHTDVAIAGGWRMYRVPSI
jgi:hypothetical protein